jgi:hypothetical protein
MDTFKDLCIMRRAVLLTGALRTIRKTMRFFKRNVLCSVDRHEVAVFACVQNDTQESDASWTEWLRSEIGPCLLDVTWFSLEKYPGWVAHRDLQLENVVVSEAWKGYLRNSGSMIEYFQLQLAYMKVCRTEAIGGFRYDYVIRARTDSIYAKPVDFHWLDWSEEEVARRIQVIREELVASRLGTGPSGLNQVKEVTDHDVFRYFMCTLWSEAVLPNLPFITVEHVPSATEVGPPSMDASAVRRYLHEGRYILTIRKNNLYVIRRDLFHFVPTLGTMYGFLRSPHSDSWWFNAEGQFRDACYYSCVSVFEYSSAFEERSLAYPHEWVEADFFDVGGEVIHPRMMYCVVRK